MPIHSHLLTRICRVVWLSAMLGVLMGCAHQSHLGYYLQSAQGHAEILQAARPIDAWLAQEDLSPTMRTRLQLAQQARSFAVQEMGLPDNASYRRYADLQRPWAVWNVVAAPIDKLQLHQWCFWVTGCIGYRGYFDEKDARAEAAQLTAQGLEVSVYSVPAYSTLGYLNWAGGDPLLNTFIHWPEGDFVALLLHEMAHQVVYAKGDTLFNESFATAVERIGVKRWFTRHGSADAYAHYAAKEERREEFRTLTQATRKRLEQIFDQKHAYALENQALIAIKNEAMDQFKTDYAALRERWLNEAGEHATRLQLAGYDRWVANANNASFAAQAAYHALVPAFMALWEREGGQPARFYDAVRALAQSPPAQRHAALQALLANDFASAP
jgi:predicted aminopeptidase